MKKIVTLIVTVTLLLMIAPTTMAQTFTAGKNGLMIGFDSSSSEISGIFYVNDRFSINPSFSYSHYGQDQDDSKREITLYSIETGLYHNIDLSEQMSLFIGPKLGYHYLLDEYSSYSSKQEKKEEGIVIAGVLGMQYMFNDKFGIIGSVKLQSIRFICKQTYDDNSEELIRNQTNTNQNLSVVFFF